MTFKCLEMVSATESHIRLLSDAALAAEHQATSCFQRGDMKLDTCRWA